MTSPITISQLFTPAPSGVGLNPNVPPGTGTWLQTLLTVASQVGLDTTSWQPGAPERTILAIAAVALANEDVLISTMNQGGFLDFSASGTVTGYNVDGTSVTLPVTPDPSIASQNPTGAPGWLDALGTSVYDVERIDASYASGSLYLVNTGNSSSGTYQIGVYHVANVSTGNTYSNRNSLVIPSSVIPGTGGVIIGFVSGSPSTVTTQSAHGLAIGDVVYVNGIIGISGLNGAFAQVTAVPSVTTFQVTTTTSGVRTSGGIVYKCTAATFTADVIGIASNAAAGAVTVTVTPLPGVLVSNLNSWSAANYESNVAYAARCRLSLAAASPNGPSQAYEYFALTSSQILAAEDPPYVFTNGPIAVANAFSNPGTGVVTTVVASTTPASTVYGQPVTPGCVNLSVTGATLTTPIIVTTAANHGLSDGDSVIISGVLGTTAANGAFIIHVTAANAFSLDGSSANAPYVGGGQVDGGDLGEVDNLLQARVVPDSVASIVESALAFPVLVEATVVVPQFYATTYAAAASASIQALLASYPIGGNIPSGGSNGTVPYEAISGALFDAGVVALGAPSYVRDVPSLIINSVETTLDYPAPNYQALFVSPILRVIGV